MNVEKKNSQRSRAGFALHVATLYYYVAAWKSMCMWGATPRTRLRYFPTSQQVRAKRRAEQEDATYRRQH